jgi:diaminopimelate decarboxylase
MTTKPQYETPTIVRHVMGMMNKLARAQAMQPMTHIDGVAVSDLVERHGSPLFVFSEKTLVDRYRDLHGSMARRWPKVQLAWSYKTNYLDAICRVFHREGSWAEVVSEMEYDKARRLGIPGSRILFNGPFKPEGALAKAFREGARVHLDHFDEIQRAEGAAREVGTQPRVSIRVNMSVAGTPPWTRFGFNLENGQALDAVRRIEAGGVLRMAGLHCHIGTFVQDAEAYREEASKLAEFANQLKARFGIEVDSIDIGGGFASRNTLHSQYLPGEQVTPSFGQYAEAIAEGLGTLSVESGKEPTLFLETGRALVDEAGYLITTVHANKRLPDGRKALIVDAGVNLLPTAFWYKHDVAPAQEFNGTPEATIIHGPLCMNIDTLRDQLLFPPMDTGDRLVFRNVGAYNVTQWMQFIATRPAVVLVSRSGEASVIRRAETLESLTALEETPEWLR